jgi:hypothetical protein
MKKFIVVIVLNVFHGMLVFGQNEIETGYVSFKAKVGSAIEYLDDKKSYKVVVPEDPTQDKKRFGSLNQSLGLDAKRAKGNEPTDKVFSIVTSGIKEITRYEDQPHQDASGFGFVRKVYFNFPVKVIVSNSTGETEKEIVLIKEDTELSEVFHAGTATGATSPTFGPIPFKSAELLNAEYQNQPAIAKLIEKKAIDNIVLAKLKLAINAAYGVNKYSLGFLYFYAPSKASAASVPDLAAKCNDLKTALSELNDKGKEEGALKKMNELFGYFSDNANTNASNSLRQLYSGNAALTALLSGNLQQAEDIFADFYSKYIQQNKVADFSGYYEGLYGMYDPYYKFKQAAGKNIELNVRPRAFDDKKKKDELATSKIKQAKDSTAQANALPKYNGESGYLDFSESIDGQSSVRGNIYYDFNTISQRSESGITTKIKVVVQTKAGKAEIPLYLISIMVVGEKKYKSVELKAGNILEATAAATNIVPDKEFWEVLQEDEKALYLRNPRSGEFAVLLAGDKQAYEVNDVIKNRRPAKEFFVKCPALKDAIASGVIKPVETQEDFKQFYQWLQNNCK